jgi:hypothetical protein
MLREDGCWASDGLTRKNPMTNKQARKHFIDFSFRPLLGHASDKTQYDPLPGWWAKSVLLPSKAKSRRGALHGLVEFVAGRPVECNVIPTQSEAMGRNLALG